MGVMAVDFRASVDLKAVAAQYRQQVTSQAATPEGKAAQESITRLEEATGAKMEDVAAALKPAGLVYLLPGDDHPAAVMIAALADKAKATEILKNLEKKSKTPPKAQKIADLDATVFDSGKDQVGYVLVDDYLFAFTSPHALETALSTYHGKSPNLASTPSLVEARKRLSVEDGSFLYSPLGPVLSSLVDKKKIPGDAQTQAGLKALPYVAWQINKDGDSEGFMPVDPKAGALASTLLAPSHNLGSALDWIPSDMNLVVSLDLHYLVEVIKQLAALAPDGRGYGAMIGSLPQRIGLTETELWDMLSGQVALGFKTSTVLPQMGGSFAKAEGVLLLGVKDPGKVAGFIKAKAPMLQLGAEEDLVAHSIGSVAYCLAQKPEPYLIVVKTPDSDKTLKSIIAKEKPVAQLPALKAIDSKLPCPLFLYTVREATQSKGPDTSAGLTGYTQFSVEKDGIRSKGGYQFGQGGAGFLANLLQVGLKGKPSVP